MDGSNIYLNIIVVVMIIGFCAGICVIKRPKLMLKLILGVFLVWLGIWISCWETPYKYALREEQFATYKDYVLIREVHYTGTGWTIIGDETGYFSWDKQSDKPGMLGGIER